MTSTDLDLHDHQQARQHTEPEAIDIVTGFLVSGLSDLRRAAEQAALHDQDDIYELALRAIEVTEAVMLCVIDPETSTEPF